MCRNLLPGEKNKGELYKAAPLSHKHAVLLAKERGLTATACWETTGAKGDCIEFTGGILGS